ncbi:hypothetical protein ETAA8_31270 [Anatilimnocola aggregata]|uniref:Uncharacterized protein n=1 Tax=Anatilimnocola aggregata TaxID=2528021 RepID=A0A517YCR6_9BACT|nr:hypothetical protein ETAA8_31270 [Anatilimnocola aggregata]
MKLSNVIRQLIRSRRKFQMADGPGGVKKDALPSFAASNPAPSRSAIFGKKHMDHVCKEYMDHYHKERNALAIKPRTRNSTQPVESLPMNEIRCTQRLAVLLKSYGRKSA